MSMVLRVSLSTPDILLDLKVMLKILVFDGTTWKEEPVSNIQ